MRSQSIKKSKKNHSRLPRTAGLRTLSELTGELTKAGIDPSRIQDRAIVLAKVQGAKRKWRSGDEEMDVDVDTPVDGGEDAEGGWMDVDGEEADEGGDSPRKRVKSNSGAVVPANRRNPRSNRQLAGMKNDAVRFHLSIHQSRIYAVHPYSSTFFLYSKPPKLSNYAILDSVLGICTQRLAKPIVRSESKRFVFS
jgi:hypothetical protein